MSYMTIEDDGTHTLSLDRQDKSRDLRFSDLYWEVVDYVRRSRNSAECRHPFETRFWNNGDRYWCEQCGLVVKVEEG